MTAFGLDDTLFPLLLLFGFKLVFRQVGFERVSVEYVYMFKKKSLFLDLDF